MNTIDISRFFTGAPCKKEELPACGKLLFSHFCIPLTAENLSALLIDRRKLTCPMRLTR